MKFSLILIATILGSALATPVALSPEAAIELRAPQAPKAPGSIIIAVPGVKKPTVNPFKCPKPQVVICPKPITPRPCKCRPVIIKVPYCPVKLPKFPKLKLPKIF